MDEMMRKISAYHNGTILRISWDSGRAVIEGAIDTIYETDNGVEEDEKGYLEFYACAVFVKRIIQNLNNKPLVTDRLIEISIENQPSKIELTDGTVIWKS